MTMTQNKKHISREAVADRAAGCFGDAQTGQSAITPLVLDGVADGDEIASLAKQVAKSTTHPSNK